ncbi:3TM-type holin [Pacificispira sp.]|uniref:3TM-type holin n=1 Tax=Pacificispira sp. TaxID=2888761 RepID=UPI003BAC1A7F
MSLFALAGTLLGGIFSVIDKSVADKDEAARLKAELQTRYLEGSLIEYKEAASIIRAEAQSEHWLAATWRPILMMVIVAIIANNYILAPYVGLFAGPEYSLTLELPDVMWETIKIGLGGYIVGRSAEKVAKEWKGRGEG